MDENSPLIGDGELDFKKMLNSQLRFWGWLLLEAEGMKLPMTGAPTLRKYLEHKRDQYMSYMIN